MRILSDPSNHEHQFIVPRERCCRRKCPWEPARGALASCRNCFGIGCLTLPGKILTPFSRALGAADESLPAHLNPPRLPPAAVASLLDRFFPAHVHRQGQTHLSQKAVQPPNLTQAGRLKLKF